MSKLLLVDFDNTIIKNPFDVDITNNLELFLKTWDGLKTQPINKTFINWLKCREFIIFTNRSSETHKKVKEHLTELNLLENVTDFLYCEGNKLKIWHEIKKAVKDEAILIDNAKKYKPHLLMSEKVIQWDLQYFEKRYKLATA
jgi:hypothetical protein